MELNLFQNHEIIKMIDPYAELFGIAAHAILILLILYPFKKREENGFLGSEETDMLKGLAILCVVIGHVSAHALKAEQRFLGFGDFGVSFFFVLSGFGLARSYLNSERSLATFVGNRVRRVLIPYWIATGVIVVLDWIILDKQYRLSAVILTLFGINVSDETAHIDYVRWYITVLLIWYGLFGICWRTLNKEMRPAFLGGIGVFICNYYLLHVGYAILSFPFGVMLGLHLETVNAQLGRGRGKVLPVFVGLFLMGAFWVCKCGLPKLTGVIPSIVLTFAREILYVLCFGSLAIITWAFKGNDLLRIFGQYSYEIFLFHGVLLVRYDLVLFRAPLIVTFLPFLMLVLVISQGMQQYVFKPVMWMAGSK
jgi:peptidoglycan/LPS O-acetylase OafA/YrhL